MIKNMSTEIYGYDYKRAAHLWVTDEDAADFLQSQFANDLRPFAAGKCTYGLWLDVKGKVIADGPKNDVIAALKRQGQSTGK